MAEIFGWLNKIIGEEDGYRLAVSIRTSKSCVLTSGSMLICSAIMPPFPKYTPLLFHGEFKDGVFAASDFAIWSSPEGVSGCLSGLHLLNAADSRKIFKTVIPSKLLRASEDDYDFLLSAGIEEPAALGMIAFSSKLREEYSAWRLLTDLGLSLEQIDRIIGLYEEDTLRRLEQNPYRFECRLPLALCDRIADYINLTSGHAVPVFPRFCGERQRLILHYASDLIASSGSVLCRADELPCIIRRCTKDAEKVNIDLLIAYALTEPDIFVPVSMDGALVFYLSRYYYMENASAEMIDTLMNTSHPALLPAGSLKKYDEDQKAAIIGCLSGNGISLITGGPGTGKTTVLKEVIKGFEKNGALVALCAPTGRAASRAKESTGHTSSTIHKLIGVKNVADLELSSEYNEDNPLPYDVVVVDEASMVDLELLWHLLRAVKPESRIIFVGDPNQLPSVTPGNVLGDLMESGKIPAYHLSVIHRQKNGSSIVDNSYRILEKNADRLEQDAGFTIMNYSDRNKAMQDLVQFYVQNYDVAHPSHFQILTTTKRGALGRIHINDEITSLIPGRTQKHGPFAVGDKVMTIRNNYAAATPYMNGDIGVIRDIDQDAVYIRSDTGKDIMVTINADMELAYASTIHKSQGSEYDTALIVMDNEYPSMLYNNLIYTAITRAKKQVIILNVNHALEQAINRPSPKRMSGMTKKI